MKKKITASLYTCERRRYNHKTHERERETLRDGCLYSNGKYPTGIRPEDLPDSYIKGNFYGIDGYMKASGIKYLLYVPNLWINHFLKDDFLFISYDKPIVMKEGGDSKWDNEGYDEYVWGSEIISMLKAAEKYSGYDISSIKQQIEEKRQILMQKHPDDFSMKWWQKCTPEYLWNNNNDR